MGFGDFYAVGDTEKWFAIPLMFFGVMIFSYVTGVYGEILDKMKSMDNDHEEGNELLKFFDVIKHFNNNEGLKKELKDEIEDYFIYRWTNHRTLPLESDLGQNIMGTKLTNDIILKFYLGFVFEPFMKVFGRTFSIPIPF